MTFNETILASAIGFLFVKLAGILLDAVIGKYFTQESQKVADLIVLEQTALEVKNTAIDYWLANNSDINRYKTEAALEGRLTYLGKLVSSIFDEQQNVKRATDIVLNQFHDAVSGGEFGVKDRLSEPTRIRIIEMRYYFFIDHVKRQHRQITPWVAKLKP